MAENKSVKKCRVSNRRLIQLYSALLYNANLRGFVSGRIFTGDAKSACVPGLNCYSCPGAVAACPLGALQNALAASGRRAPWYVLGILALFGLIAGRTICGWLCPMGLFQELLHRVPTPKLRKGRATRALSWLKYLILAALVVAVPLWYGLKQGLQVPAFCKLICPAGTLEGAVALLSNPVNDGMFPMLGALFTSKFIILASVALLCVFCHRAFCRFLCPLGAIYGLFHRFALIGVRVDESRCVGCRACVRRCEMDVRRVGDRECIHCAKCMDDCAFGAISLKCGSITLKGPESPEPAAERAKQKKRRIAWAVALAALAAALAWINLIRPV